MNHLLCIRLIEMYIKQGKISAWLEHQTRGLLENMKSIVVCALFQGMAGILVPLSTLVVHEYFMGLDYVNLSFKAKYSKFRKHVNYFLLIMNAY